MESKRRLRPTVRRGYQTHIEVHLKPWLGKVPLSGLRADHRLRGNRSRLELAEPLTTEVPAGAELGRGLLSRRRLHDLRHASASIQLQEGIDLALVSKRLGHSSPAITGALYAHLLRPPAAPGRPPCRPRGSERRAAFDAGRHAHITPTMISRGQTQPGRNANLQVRGGGRGIRTHDEVAPIAVFKPRDHPDADERK